MVKYFTVIVPLFFLLSCKKDEISILKKGRWNLQWEYVTTIKGEINFKGNGKGVFYPEGTSDKVPFNYTVDGTKATFQWENPNASNMVHVFDVVISNNTSQVWEGEKNNYNGNTFVLTK